MTTTQLTFELIGKDALSNPLNAIANQFSRLDRQMVTTGTSAGGLASGLLGVATVAGGNLLSAAVMGLGNALSELAGGIAQVGREMVNSNAQFENYETRFKVLLGSTEAAKQRMMELEEFGRTTPFELPGVVKADLILQGFGLHSEQAAAKFGYSGEEIRRISGDVASGTGQSFEDIAGYIGRFTSGATGEAIMRFQELGIATREQLAAMGLEFSKSGELLSPLPEAGEVLLTLMKEKYGGLMDAQSGTFEGMLSNLADWRGQTLRIIGQPIFELLREKLGQFVTFISGPAVQGAIENFSKHVGQTMNSLRYIIDNSVIPGLLKLAGVVIGAGVNPLDAFFHFINWKVMPTLLNFSNWFFNTGAPAVVKFVQDVARAYQTNGLSGVIDRLLLTLASAWPKIQTTLLNWATQFWNWITAPGGVLTNTTGTLDQVIMAASKFLEKSWPTIRSQLTVWAGRFWGWILGNDGQPGVIDQLAGAMNRLLDELVKWSSSKNTQGKLQLLANQIGSVIYDTMIIWASNQEKMNTLMGKLLDTLLKAIGANATIQADIGSTLASGIITGFMDRIGLGQPQIRRSIEGALRGAAHGLNPLSFVAGLAIPGFAKGGNFTVPPGYPRDSFLMGVSSGEEVSVTPRGGRETPANQNNNNTTKNFYLTINSNAPIEPILADFHMMDSML